MEPIQITCLDQLLLLCSLGVVRRVTPPHFAIQVVLREVVQALAEAEGVPVLNIAFDLKANHRSIVKTH